MDYEELQEAMQVFGLSQRATIRQIKDRHRELVKQFHPDHNKSKDLNHIRKVNRAFKTLTTYCSNYRYCFSEEEFLEQVPEARLKKQFGWDPLWSGQKEEK